MPLVQQGITVLGTPLGSVEFVQAHLQKTLADHDTLFSRIPLLDDTQSAWALLLHCAGSRANYLLRVIRPELVQNFEEGHNAGLWRCLAQILPASTGADPIAKSTASLPLSMGGLGLRDASRTSELAFWASWADCLSMIRKRHPEVALEMVRQLNGVDACPSLHAGIQVSERVDWGRGFRTSHVGRSCEWFATSHTRCRRV